MRPELTLVLLELEAMVDAFVDEGLEVTGAAEELVNAFVEEPALDVALDAALDRVVVAAEGLVEAFVEEPALDGVVDGVVEAGADVDGDEEPGAAKAGTAAPARTRM